MNADYKYNIVISMTGVGANRPFSCLMSELLPDLGFMACGQCFPLYWYPDPDGDPVYAISPGMVEKFRKVYPAVFRGFPAQKNAGRFARCEETEEVTEKDIFYYIYGVLHHPFYRKKYAVNLNKEMPRIPMLKGFSLISSIGRALARLHVDYEKMPEYAVTEECIASSVGRIEKMKFGRLKTAAGNKIIDKSVIVCHAGFRLSEIPLKAYDYEVNGRSAIEWIMDRYQVRTAKGSGIVNDPNLYSKNPGYIISLLKKVIYVSLETIKLVEMLPEFREVKADR